jgi:Tol biopolymer transport system component
MNNDQWDRLSTWHGAWLAAGADERRALRARLSETQPDLDAHADELTADGSALHDFLETPAFVLAARRMARETATLPAGTDVGPYRVTGLIAHGGMGVVYRGTDVRLQRDVALKMLTPIGPPDEARVDRFLREARLTASIDHPNVVKVYDVGVFADQPYIVVELLDGETLRTRLGRGPLAVAAARAITIEIARGLSAAHAAGLVHRDLKPENVFLTRAGVTKVLDFGIAKLAPGSALARGAAPTVTGVLIGTAAYLSPEQVRGDETDGRADLFALGSLLTEMLTGEPAFAGPTPIDTLHAILHAPAPDLASRRADVPHDLAGIVARLLEKGPADRFQSATDLAWALEQFGDVRSKTATPVVEQPRADPRAARRWPWILAPVAFAVLALAWWWQARLSPVDATPGPLTRFAWTLPAGTTLFSAPAVSPDGRRICWTGRGEAGDLRLFVREMSSVDARPVAGTDDAQHPFWSPDGQAIGFFAQGKLKRVAVDGGSPIVLADAPEGRGGTWNAAGVIVFAPNFRDAPLLRVSDRGGPTVAVTAIDRAQEDVTNRWPAFLPDGIHFLYSVVSLRDDRRGIYVGSVEGAPARSPQRLFASDSGAIYVSLGDGRPGAILSAGPGRVEVRPFEPTARLLAGDVRTVGIRAIETSPRHAALLGVSATVLAYSDARIPWGSRLTAIGRDGADLRTLSAGELGGFPRLSPDGARLARSIVDPVRGNPDIWVYDLGRQTRMRLTTSMDVDITPAWSPDGREVVYRSGALTESVIAIAAADGTGVTRTLPCPARPCEPSDWSPDGTYLIVTVGGRDIWTVPLSPGATPQPLLADAFTERDARISPDGRWLAYVSDESGRAEVYVRHLRGRPRRYVVSSGGGDQPVWGRGGSELFFTGGGRLYSAPVRLDASEDLVFGPATRLQVPELGERHWGTTYDVSADGRRVYFGRSVDDRAPEVFGVVLHWRAFIE